MLMPFLLIGFGVLFLLENLGILPPVAWDMFWPVILIVIGLAMVFHRMGWDHCPMKSVEKKAKKG